MIPANQKYCHDHVNQDKNPIKLALIPIPAAVRKPDRVTLMRSMFDRPLFTRLPVITEEEPFEIFAVVPEETIPLNIPAEEFITTYIPSVTYLTVPNENGLEQKYGGRVPFFVEGDTWAHAQRPNGRVEPMVFVAQFIDPRSDKNELTQIFVPNADDINVAREGAYIRKIDLNQPLKQIWIPSPVPKGWTRPTKAAYVIQDWLVTYEIPFSNYRKHIKAALDEESDAPDFVKQKWIDDEEFPDYRDSIGSIFKIGGVGFSNVYKDYLLDYQNFFGQEDGSGDHLHIGADGHLEVDPDIRT